METAIPFFREQGTGAGVVCLHSNASSSGQWRTLTDLLSNRFTVIAVDGYGAGKSPQWPVGPALRLEDEVRLLDPALQRAGDRFHLVGHSYGAAVAVKTALMQPQRVRSLVLYEPTLFHLVAGADPLVSPAQGIWRAATDAAAAVDHGDLDAAAERFIDFWMGAGSWQGTPAVRQAGIAGATANVRTWRDTLFNETFAPSALATLDLPVLLLTGERSPESSLSVARILEGLLPKVTVVALEGIGHMGPITHPEVVNRRIADFLDRN